MTSPTDELSEDHAIVRAGLRALAAVGKHVRRGGHFPASDTAALLRLLREFFIATHLRKENEVVWPAMAMRAGDDAAEAVGELVRAQEDASDLVRSLVYFWEPVGGLTAGEREGFADTVDALQLSMQRLQEIEERMFRECDSDVPIDDQIDWRKRFATIEAERASRALWERRLRRLASVWAA